MTDRDKPRIYSIERGFKKGGIGKKSCSLSRDLYRFSPVLYFLIGALPPVAAGLLPALRTGTLETGILVRGGSLD